MPNSPVSGFRTHHTLNDSHDPIRISIVGIGRSDVLEDDVGPRVIDGLRRRGCDVMPSAYAVSLRDIGTTPLALLDHLDGQDLLLLVDACTLGLAPATIVEFEPNCAIENDAIASTHQLDAFAALTITAYLYPDQLPKRTVVMVVETEGISIRQLEAACAAVVERIVERVNGYKTVSST